MTDRRMSPRYGALVRRRFFRRRSAAAGLALVGCFLFAAALAPFLAGGRPLVLVDDEGPSFPVLAAFGPGDFLWLVLPLLIAAWRIAGRIRVLERLGVTRARRAWAAILLALAATITACLWPERLDRSDYGDLRDGVREARLCLWPPVPYGPAEFDSFRRLEGPSKDHWLGLDEKGRDLLSRLIHGARISMLVGFVAVSIYVILGVLVGALAGYFGGVIDLILCRIMEVVICFPLFFLILAVFCFLPPSVLWVMLLIGLFRWPGVARLTRGEFLRLRNQDYVVAARALGMSHARVIFYQMLPNGLAPVLVAATFGIAGAILLESGLSFLGFGVQPPTPSWGKMLADSRTFMDMHPRLTLWPGMAIFSAVMAFNLVGEGLRDALDPRTKR